METQINIENWRAKIDALDEIIVGLLNLRTRYAIQIGKLKIANGEPIYSPERETSVLHRVEELNTGPLDNRAVRRVYEKIMDEIRKLELENIKLDE